MITRLLISSARRRLSTDFMTTAVTVLICFSLNAQPSFQAASATGAFITAFSWRPLLGE
jgi:hypothetical protein